MTEEAIKTSDKLTISLLKYKIDDLKSQWQTVATIYGEMIDMGMKSDDMETIFFPEKVR